jgi:hypothetical protein
VVVHEIELPEGDRDPLVGSNHWLVYENAGDGFATSPDEWPIPFPLEIRDSSLANQSHSVVDLDGDRRPDFVVHRDDERLSGTDPLVGRNHWLLFENTGSGFARSETEWALPFSLAGNSDFVNAEHSILDAGGDGQADFMIVRDTERSEADLLAGKAHWPVFQNSGAGFDGELISLELPYPLVTPTQNNSALSTDHHLVMDMDGDGLLDFVEFDNGEREQTDALLGRNHWRVYFGDCEG